MISSKRRAMRLSNKTSLSSSIGVSNGVLDGGAVVDGYGRFRLYGT